MVSAKASQAEKSSREDKQRLEEYRLRFAGAARELDFQDERKQNKRLRESNGDQLLAEARALRDLNKELQSRNREFQVTHVALEERMQMLQDQFLGLQDKAAAHL